MPAQRLRGLPVSLGKYDVVGQDSGSIPLFVRHIGLADEQRTDFGLETETSTSTDGWGKW